MVTPIEFVICLGLLSFSAFFAASEVALFSLSRSQLRYLKDNFRAAFKKIRKLLSDPGGVLVTILFCNELTNIILSSIVAKAVNRRGHLGQFIDPSIIPLWAQQALAGTAITAPLILLFGEITPKGIAARANQIIAPLTVTPLYALYYLLTPVRASLNFVIQGTRRLLGGGEASEQPSKETQGLKEEELLIMAEEGMKEGEINPREMKLIQNVLSLDDLTVEQIYTPISQVQTLTSQTSFRAALSQVRGTRITRVPVVSQQNRKQVVGILYIKDLLQLRLTAESDASTIESILRKPLIVSVKTRLNVLFKRFKQTQTHIALVERSPGEPVGTITLDDVIDALFEGILGDDSEIGR